MTVMIAGAVARARFMFLAHGVQGKHVCFWMFLGLSSQVHRSQGF